MTKDTETATAQVLAEMSDEQFSRLIDVFVRSQETIRLVSTVIPGPDIRATFFAQLDKAGKENKEGVFIIAVSRDYFDAFMSHPFAYAIKLGTLEERNRGLMGSIFGIDVISDFNQDTAKLPVGLSIYIREYKQ
jgi:hypothetical protein